METGTKYADEVLGAGCDTDAAIRAGVAIARPFEIGRVDGADERFAGIVVPQGYKLRSLERYASRPSGKRGAATFHDVGSFCAYVLAHRTPGTTIARTQVKFDAAGRIVGLPAVRAVLDGHEPENDAAGWGRHVADLVFTVSRRLSAWLAVNGQAKALAEMTEFVEDRIGDIAEPSGTVIHGLIQRFSVNRQIVFSSVTNTQSGAVDLVFRESDHDGVKPTTASVPELFTLMVPIFEGDEPALVRVRFRYRLAGGAGGGVSVTFKLAQIEDTIEAAVLRRVEAVKAATKIEPLYGAVPSALPEL